ncbi:MAG: exodeoxyribonuclease VII large subunit [Thermoanaerobaculaceae bacterium]|nr:exodeoxyribonuclease VII large subunit [Thermoanaerobaculaceae bacterium]MDI9621507.1 exodeoxyribonuclease VII large subunit [Acidobacteriota bacterium]HPW55925.1 exodeoxyribonuclease VII large subunit [Thermoanaerobaculaceae bacterium]
MSAHVWSVGELVGAVNASLKAFGEVWVRGELSGVKVASSGHRYFQLKDAEGVLSCAMWASFADRLRFKLQDGLAVLARGKLEVYPQRGFLQLIISEVQPEGIGELQLAFEQLKAKLHAEGLFAPERKRRLPALPRRLGLVTSSSGAAVRDVLKVLSRWPHLQVLLYPVRVQGRGAEGEIARAVRYLGRSGLVDVVLVVRGGGSLEDLWSFNEEVVARAIAESPVPVISGVGHEVDFTIADFVADIRAATPTQAAELVVARLEEQARRVDQAADRAEHLFVHRLERARLRLRAAAGARGLARLPSRIQELSERLRRLEALPGRLRALVQLRHRRLDGALSRLYHWPVRFGAPRRREVVTVRLAVAAERLRALVQRRRLELAGSERALAALSPANVLQRGFSITTREGDPTPLRDVAQVRAGEHLLTRLASGELRSLVLTRQGVTQPSLFMNGDSAGGARGPDPEEGGRQA